MAAKPAQETRSLVKREPVAFICGVTLALALKIGEAFFK